MWFSHWAPGREKKKIRKKEARKIGIKYGLQVSRKYQCLSVNCDVGARQATMLSRGRLAPVGENAVYHLCQLPVNPKPFQSINFI